MYYQVEEQDGYYRIGVRKMYSVICLSEANQAALIDTGYGLEIWNRRCAR